MFFDSLIAILLQIVCMCDFFGLNFCFFWLVVVAAAAAFCVTIICFWQFLLGWRPGFKTFLLWNSNSGIESRVCECVNTRAQKKYCCWWSWWLFSGEEIFALLSSSVFFSHKSTLVLNETPSEPTLADGTGAQGRPQVRFCLLFLFLLKIIS